MREGEQLRQSRSNQAERISSILCYIVSAIHPLSLCSFKSCSVSYRLIRCNKAHEDFLKERLAICINREIHWDFPLLCKLFQVNIYDTTFTNRILLN
jgi:hypothetical protein